MGGLVSVGRAGPIRPATLRHRPRTQVFTAVTFQAPPPLIVPLSSQEVDFINRSLDLLQLVGLHGGVVQPPAQEPGSSRPAHTSGAPRRASLATKVGKAAVLLITARSRFLFFPGRGGVGQ